MQKKFHLQKGKNKMLICNEEVFADNDIDVWNAELI